MATEYIYRGEFTTATIVNEKRYWSLTITHNKASDLFEFGNKGRRITNTKKRAVEIWEAVEKGQLEMMQQFSN